MLVELVDIYTEQKVDYLDAIDGLVTPTGFEEANGRLLELTKT